LNPAKRELRVDVKHFGATEGPRNPLAWAQIEVIEDSPLSIAGTAVVDMLRVAMLMTSEVVGEDGSFG